MFQHFFSQQYENIFERLPKLVRLDYIVRTVEWKHSHHIHEHTELLYIAKDDSVFTFDFVEYTMRAGDIIVIEPGQIHSLVRNSGEIWSFIVRDFKVKGLKENTLLQPGTSPMSRAGEYMEPVESIVHAINAMKNNNNNGSIYAYHSLIGILAAMFYDIFQNSKKLNTAKPQLFIKNILMYLNENFMQQISLQNLAKQFNVSPSYISHEFTKEYHISPINYIIERRLNHAKLLLINTNENIGEISNAVGYSDINHFIKLFIKRIGTKPTEYRDYYRQRQEG